jgi:hypothetical protein
LNKGVTTAGSGDAEGGQEEQTEADGGKAAIIAKNT